MPPPHTPFSSLTTRLLAEGDRVCIPQLVALHTAAFPGFFLTSLGPAFLRLLYTGFAREHEGICLVVESHGILAGFAAGTTAPDKFFSRLLRRRALAFALAALPGLLSNPLFAARKCLGALFYRGEQPAGLANAALLSSLAVSPAFSGQGIGQQLVLAFAEEARRQGCSSLYLTTDEADNDRANRFYAKCGFVLRDTFKRPGNRIMNRWVMACSRLAA
jgi:GNAT superfamily N-acetyltransferase